MGGPSCSCATTHRVKHDHNRIGAVTAIYKFRYLLEGVLRGFFDAVVSHRILAVAALFLNEEVFSVKEIAYIRIKKFSDGLDI